MRTHTRQPSAKQGLPPKRIASLGGIALLLLGPTVFAQPQLPAYDTRYYTLHTDLGDEAVRETTVRITLMAEEYHRRTKDLAGTVNQKLPFYLFKDRAAYEAAGGPAGSAGVFNGRALMAVVNPDDPNATWHVIQHEGFHQFVHAAIGTGIPIWANEGLAEYFGQALFTGDSFTLGLIPPDRLARIKAALAEGRFQPLRDMMRTTTDTWNAALTTENYDQAWSMVYFLVHADDGRYQRAFIGVLRDIGRGMHWEKAWIRNFGRDIRGFQKRWESYWTQLPDDPTADLHAKAITSTLTSFYARAFSQRQVFESFGEFVAAATAGTLKAHERDWLPAHMLRDALRIAPQVGEWRIEHKPGRWLLICKCRSGNIIEGSFRIRAKCVHRVSVKLREDEE